MFNPEDFNWDEVEDDSMGIKKPKKDEKKNGECTCPKEVWMNRGCQCGAAEKYTLKPSKNAKHYL